MRVSGASTYDAASGCSGASTYDAASGCVAQSPGSRSAHGFGAAFRPAFRPAFRTAPAKHERLGRNGS